MVIGIMFILKGIRINMMIKTYNDKKIEVDTPNKKEVDEVDNRNVEEGITIKLMA